MSQEHGHLESTHDLVPGAGGEVGAPRAPTGPSHWGAATTPLERSAPTTRAPPRRIDHTYRDYSNFPVDDLPVGKKALTNFPSKLHQILSFPGYSHIISWMPHGRAWKIHDKELLIREVVPKYFVQSKYESFTRQLNGWGFKRLHQSGNDFNAYYHEYFLRGVPHLTALMKRVQSNKGKLLPHVEGEPNFYEIEKQFPLAPSAMPYQGHFQHYPQSHMAGVPGYGAPTGKPGYHHSLNHSSSYPGAYPPRYPPPYYPYHGNIVETHVTAAAAGYPSQPGYPPYPAHYPATQYGQSLPEYHPHAYRPGPPYGATPPPPYENPPSFNNTAAPVRFDEISSDYVTNKRAPVQEGRKEESFDPLYVFSEQVNSTSLETPDNY